MLFLSVLFVIVLMLLAFALTKDKGQNTVHARGTGRSAGPRRKLPLSGLRKESDTLHAN